MNRTERRAIEHKARKEAQKAARLAGLHPAPADNQTGEPNTTDATISYPCASLPSSTGPDGHPAEDIPVYTPPPTPSARLAANRRNAQLSTGPNSITGKAHSSLNALKTGLTGRTVLLPGEDVDVYQNFVGSIIRKFRPVGLRECELVQAIADTRWRLARISSLEANIYSLAQIELADLFPDHAPHIRAALIDAKTFLVYNRQLNNLSIHENRLQRRLEKDLAELCSLQADRPKSAPQNAIRKPGSPYNNPHDASTGLPDGFEFSLQDPELLESHHLGTSNADRDDFALESGFEIDSDLPSAA